MLLWHGLSHVMRITNMFASFVYLRNLQICTTQNIYTYSSREIFLVAGCQLLDWVSCTPSAHWKDHKVCKIAHSWAMENQIDAYDCAYHIQGCANHLSSVIFVSWEQWALITYFSPERVEHIFQLSGALSILYFNTNRICIIHHVHYQNMRYSIIFSALATKIVQLYLCLWDNVQSADESGM